MEPTVDLSEEPVRIIFLKTYVCQLATRIFNTD